MELLQCQFWDGWGLSTPPSWDTTLWCIRNQAEISRLKIKFGDLPRWVRSCLKQKPTPSWKLPLCSWEPNVLVPCEPSKRGLGGSLNLGNTKWKWAAERFFNLKTLVFRANILVFSLSLEEEMPLEGLFKFTACKVKTLELAAWRIEACIGLSKPVEHFHTENVLFWAPDVSLIFQMMGRVNWRHGLWMMVLTYKQGWKGTSSLFDSTNNKIRTYLLNKTTSNSNVGTLIWKPIHAYEWQE